MFYPQYFIYILKYQYFTDGDVSMCRGLAGGWRCGSRRLEYGRRGGDGTEQVLTSGRLQRSHVSCFVKVRVCGAFHVCIHKSRPLNFLH